MFSDPNLSQRDQSLILNLQLFHLGSRSIANERSRYMPNIHCSEAPSSRLGKRTLQHCRATVLHQPERSHSNYWRQNRRGKPKRADYLLRYRRDFPIAVVEAKADYKTPGAGLSQAKKYAEILDLKFAFATNGKGIVEFDYITGIERSIATFPTPAELWVRLEKRPLATPEEEKLSLLIIRTRSALLGIISRSP